MCVCVALLYLFTGNNSQYGKLKTPGRKRIYNEEICNMALNGAVIPEKWRWNGSLNPRPCWVRVLIRNGVCLITSISVLVLEWLQVKL
jgi:hypothetical protein